MFERAGGVRVLVGLGIALLFAFVLVTAGSSDGSARMDLSVSDGAVWLPSNDTSLVQLVDQSGLAGKAVPIGGVKDRPAAPFDVVQAGADAVVVRHDVAAVRRVSLATESMAPDSWVRLAGLSVDEGRQDLQAFIDGGELWVYSPTDGLAQQFELATFLSSRGVEVGEPSISGAVRDGELWLLGADGHVQVASADGKGELRRFEVMAPGPGLIVNAGGTPVVVEAAGASLAVLKDSGVERRCDLGFDSALSDFDAAASGSTVAVINHETRELAVARNVDTDGCDVLAQPLVLEGSFGSPVVAGERIFLPERSNGQIVVVEIDGSVTNVALAGAEERPLDLVADGDTVFYNDPTSTFAGVLPRDLDPIPVTKSTEATNPDEEGDAVVVDPEEKPDEEEDAPEDEAADEEDSPEEDEPDDDEAVTANCAVGPSEVREGDFVTAELRFGEGEVPDVASVTWDFGDGEAVAGELVEGHRYAREGVYSVALRLEFGGGGSEDVSCGSVRVRGEDDPLPLVAGFGVPLRIVAGVPADFADGSTPADEIDSRVWTFDEATPSESTSRTPTVTWDDPGQYTVSVRVVRDGVSDTHSATVTVESEPEDAADIPADLQGDQVSDAVSTLDRLGFTNVSVGQTRCFASSIRDAGRVGAVFLDGVDVTRGAQLVGLAEPIVVVPSQAAIDVPEFATEAEFDSWRATNAAALSELGITFDGPNDDPGEPEGYFNQDWHGPTCGDRVIEIEKGTRPALRFTEDIVVGDGGDGTFFRLRFTASESVPWVAELLLDGALVQTKSGNTEAGVQEPLEFDNLQPGSTYLVRVILDGSVTDQEQIMTPGDGGTGPADAVEILSVTIADRNATDFLVVYDTNIPANGSYVVINTSTGAQTHSNAGQTGGSLQTDHQARPGVFANQCCGGQLLLDPATTYRIEITVVAGNGTSDVEVRTVTTDDPPQPKVTVPDVIGMDRSAALAALSQAGLQPTSHEVHPATCSAIAISTSPAAGAVVDIDSFVTPSFSWTCTVPNLIGTQGWTAAGTLSAAGFNNVTLTFSNCPVPRISPPPDSPVTGQSVPAGTVTDPNTGIHIDVAWGHGTNC